MFSDKDFPPLMLWQRKSQAMIMFSVLVILMPILVGALAWQTMTVIEQSIEIQQLKSQLKQEQ